MQCMQVIAIYVPSSEKDHTCDGLVISPGYWILGTELAVRQRCDTMTITQHIIIIIITMFV